MSIKHRKIAQWVAYRSKLPMGDAIIATDAVFEAIIMILEDKGEVRIKDFCKFKIRVYKDSYSHLAGKVVSRSLVKIVPYAAMIKTGKEWGKTHKYEG